MKRVYGFRASDNGLLEVIPKQAAVVQNLSAISLRKGSGKYRQFSFCFSVEVIVVYAAGCPVHFAIKFFTI